MERDYVREVIEAVAEDRRYKDTWRIYDLGNGLLAKRAWDRDLAKHSFSIGGLLADEGFDVIRPKGLVGLDGEPLNGIGRGDWYVLFDELDGKSFNELEGETYDIAIKRYMEQMRGIIGRGILPIDSYHGSRTCRPLNCSYDVERGELKIFDFELWKETRDAERIAEEIRGLNGWCGI